jgi:hypothetical protein
LGGVSRSVGEGFSVPVSPLHVGGSEFASLPMVEICVGALDIGYPAVEGSPLGAKPTPLMAVILAFPLISITGIDSGALVDVSVRDLGKNSVQGGGLWRLSQVRFPDFPLSWEDDLSVSPIGREWVDFDVMVLDSIDLPGEEETLALVSTQAKPDRKSSLAKSMIKWGFLGPRATAPPMVVDDVLPN